MDDDVILADDLAPVRAPTLIFEQIEQLANERRALLSALPNLEQTAEARHRLAEIDVELERLWDARRRELGRVGTRPRPAAR